jgi:hypothetical protein
LRLPRRIEADVAVDTGRGGQRLGHGQDTPVEEQAEAIFARSLAGRKTEGRRTECAIEMTRETPRTSGRNMPSV